jgi:hypothetical protein
MGSDKFPLYFPVWPQANFNNKTEYLNIYISPAIMYIDSDGKEAVLNLSMMLEM